MADFTNKVQVVFKGGGEDCTGMYTTKAMLIYKMYQKYN